MKTPTLKGDYLFERDGSPYFYYRLQNPPELAKLLGWKTKIKSTGESDRFAAFQVALPDIIAHRTFLAANRMKRKGALGGDRASQGLKYKAGQEWHGDDGSLYKCTKDGLKVVRTLPDGEITIEENPVENRVQLEGTPSDIFIISGLKAFAEKPNRDLDQDIFDHWAKNQKRGPTTIMTKFMKTLHEVIPGKSLAILTPGDVRNLVAHLVGEKNSTSSLQAKFGLANAMVNAALGHESFPMLKTNPFKIKDLIPQGIVGRRPQPKVFDDHDLRKIDEDFINWDHQMQLAWLMYRTMAMRKSEPWQIKAIEYNSGFKCVEVGTKSRTGTDRRVLPCPEVVKGMLPDHLNDRPLFTLSADCIEGRIRDRLVAIGIPRDSGKTLHSLRHMADTFWSEKGVHQKIIDTITGHVPDDMSGNEGNQATRAKKSIKWRYFRGYGPKPLYDAMELIETGIGM